MPSQQLTALKDTGNLSFLTKLQTWYTILPFRVILSLAHNLFCSSLKPLLLLSIPPEFLCLECLLLPCRTIPSLFHPPWPLLLQSFPHSYPPKSSHNLIFAVKFFIPQLLLRKRLCKINFCTTYIIFTTCIILSDFSTYFEGGKD